MASLLSLVLATLVVGTVFNLATEWFVGEKPFRPIHGLVVDTAGWVTVYVAAAVMSGLTLVLNILFEPWACIALVTVLAFLFVLWFVWADKGVSKTFWEQAQKDITELVGYPLLGLASANGTLVLLLKVIGG